ncbi:ash family protein [Klebsiella pneumoniae]|uniref:Ash family protein n=1 Tax=Klebsiella pneumoniae TaxID=573 RepID=A0A927HR83_KLEPN|nr:ash family protein [Klebsiella pneumoniae]
MMMPVLQKPLFLACFPSPFPVYSFLAVAKSAAGRENPSYSVATPDAPCVFFLCLCLCAPVVYASVLKPLLYLRNGGSGGAAFGLAGTH